MKALQQHRKHMGLVREMKTVGPVASLTSKTWLKSLIFFQIQCKKMMMLNNRNV